MAFPDTCDLSSSEESLLPLEIALFAEAGAADLCEFDFVAALDRFGDCFVDRGVDRLGECSVDRFGDRFGDRSTDRFAFVLLDLDFDESLLDVALFLFGILTFSIGFFFSFSLASSLKEEEEEELVEEDEVEEDDDVESLSLLSLLSSLEEEEEDEEESSDIFFLALIFFFLFEEDATNLGDSSWGGFRLTFRLIPSHGACKKLAISPGSSSQISSIRSSNVSSSEYSSSFSSFCLASTRIWFIISAS